MTDKDLTAQEIANRADGEGGIWSLYERGIDPDRIIDPELAAAWRRLDEAYESVEAVKKLLPEPRW